MQKWAIEEIKLELKYEWAISRGATKEKRNFMITLSDQDHLGRGEVALSGRFGESSDQVWEKFEDFCALCPPVIANLEDLLALCERAGLPASLRFGVESAFLHFLSHVSSRSVPELLGIPSLSSVATSYSLPMMPVELVADFIQKYQLQRFSILKVKVDQDNALDLITQAQLNFSGPLIIDANEAWKSPDEVLKFQEKIFRLPVLFLEQPLPADFYDEYLDLKKQTIFPLMADESLTTQSVTPFFQERFHAVNVKLMKAGSYMLAMKQIRDAKALGMKTMIGCMIETSLGIHSAMNLASLADYHDLDGSLFLKDDPFRLIFEESGRLVLSHLH